jgi:uncharacterized membrane protein YvbJ
MVFCSKCGKELPENAYFCPACGVKTAKGIRNQKTDRKIVCNSIRRNEEGLRKSKGRNAANNQPRTYNLPKLRRKELCWGQLLQKMR